MAQRQQGDVAVDANDLTGFEDGVVAAAHQGAMAQHGAFGGARRATGEENGGRLIGIDLCHRCGGLGDAGSRADFHALQIGAERREFVADENGGDVKFAARSGHGRLRKCGRKIHRHIAGAGDGQEQLDGVLAVAVEDGDVRTFGQSQALDESPAAGDALAHLPVIQCLIQVRDSGIVGIFFADPSHKFGYGRNI